MLDFMFNWFEKAPSGALIWIFIACLIVGIIFLVKGADVFVGNASTLAKKIGVSPLVIGLTIVAFGTSAPEASVSISAALNDVDAISIGNIVGSNSFNLLVVLGLSAIFAPVIIKREVFKRDIPFMVIAGVLLLVFSIWFSQTGNFQLIRIEAILLLVVFVAYLVLCFLKPGEIEVEEETSNRKLGVCILFLLIGLIAVVAGGEFVTYGAKNVAIKMGVSETLVGLTIVAIGTSLPELVTSIVAARKHENDIAIGNVIGSNIFNILFVLGMAGTISPLSVEGIAIWDIVIMLGFFGVFIVMSIFGKEGLKRKQGIILISMYVIYLAYIIAREFI